MSFVVSCCNGLAKSAVTVIIHVIPWCAIPLVILTDVALALTLNNYFLNMFFLNIWSSKFYWIERLVFLLFDRFLIQ